MSKNTSGTKAKTLRPDRFETMYERIKRATNTQTQIQLAAILDVRQSSISDAKRRGSIPPDWVLKLLETHSVNPNWIKYGQEPMLLPEGKLTGLAKENLFSGIGLGALIAELVLKLSPDTLKEDVKRTLCMEYFTLKPSDTLIEAVSRILPGDIATLLCEHIFQNLYPQQDSGDKTREKEDKDGAPGGILDKNGKALK